MLQPDTLIHDRYRIVRLLGQGGMGAVYEAVDERLGARVALKQMLARDAGLDKAFEREARLLAGLRHPALPVVSDFFADAHGQFLVMQFIPGDDLAVTLRRRDKPFPPEQVLDWADQLLRVLVYLHGQQPPIIHHDIKPQNLKQTPNGELVLLDFGLARGMQFEQPPEATDSLPPTAPSLHAFTLQYAPLEQIEGGLPDPRSDLYALAATLYHLVTGDQPASALVRVRALVARDPDPLRPANEVTPEVPASMSAVLGKALALHAGDRPADAAEMRRMFKQVVQPLPDRPGMEPHGDEAATVVMPTSSPLTNKRRKWAMLMIAALFAISLLSIPVLQRQSMRSAGAVTTPEPVLTGSDPPVTEGAVEEDLATTATSTTAAELLPPQRTEASQPAFRFQPVPLGELANAQLDFQSPPTGQVTFAGIPFDLLGRAFKSQSSFAPYDTAPLSIEVPLETPQAYRLHLLLNSGNGFTLFQDKVVGEVRAACGDARVVVGQLQLGRDLREWHEAPKLVTQASRVQEVWSGTRTDAPGLEGHIDLLSLDLPPVCREGVLTAVEVVDLSADTVRSLDPALNLVGLTVEHYEP